MRKKNKKTIAAAVITALILLAPAANAQALWSIFWNTVKETYEILSFGIMGMVEASSIMVAAMIKANPCVYAGADASAKCTDVMGVNMPVDETIRSMNAILIKSFMPLYISFFLILGLYMIFIQGSPKGRAEAKAFFIDLIVGMVLVGASPVIFQIILNISSAISESIWSQAGVDFGTMKEWWAVGADMRTFCCYFFISIASVIAALIVATFRYFCVMILAAIFPLSVFLYSFKFTKGMGNSLMKFTFMAVFSQVIMMLSLVVGMVAYKDSSFGIPAFRMLFGIASMLSILCTPLIMLKVMHWIGGAVYAYSSRGGGSGIRFISQLMRGRSFHEALATASGRYQTTHTLGMYERGGERMKSPGWSTYEDFPDFPHKGVIGWSPGVYGSAGRLGRLRSGSTFAGLTGGAGSQRGSGGTLAPAMDPDTHNRITTPTQTKPSAGPPKTSVTPQAPPSSTPQAPSAPLQSQVGGGEETAPSVFAGGGMETRRGGETVIKGGGAKGMLKSQLPMQQPSAMTPQAEATTPPMAEAAGKAEDAGKRMAAGDGSQYIKEKIKGIQEQTQKEIEALQRQKAREIESEEILAGYHPLAGYPPEEEEEGTPPQIPYRIFPPATSEKPEKPTPTSETPAEEQGQLPSWYAKARRLGVDDNNLLKELSERGEGPANKFVDEVENALGGGYTGQSANELLRNTMRGEHLEKRKEGEE